MKDIRCTTCSKKLAEGEFSRLIIKCPRCKTLNHLNARSVTPPERHRAPLTKKETLRETRKKPHPA
ncbi:MAG: Com family DNA-binding transcriptional regulator [Azonexus sp.]|nr:Com family DNA-binding transcriptional regulator [Azonexus sp.]